MRNMHLKRITCQLLILGVEALLDQSRLTAASVSSLSLTSIVPEAK